MHVQNILYCPCTLRTVQYVWYKCTCEGPIIYFISFVLSVPYASVRCCVQYCPEPWALRREEVVRLVPEWLARSGGSPWGEAEMDSTVQYRSTPYNIVRYSTLTCFGVLTITNTATNTHRGSRWGEPSTSFAVCGCLVVVSASDRCGEGPRQRSVASGVSCLSVVVVL